MLSGLYGAAATMAAPGLRLLLSRRASRGKEILARLPERRGVDATPRPPGRLLWLHAASVGEAMSVLPLLGPLCRHAPDATVLMTTGTVTSAELLEGRLADCLEELAVGERRRALHRFVPLDVPAWAARFLDHWRPDAAAFVESEIWPNLLRACHHRGIPLMLVNARLSERSFARWRRVPGLSRALFGGFAAVQPQSEADAERLLALGARGVALCGNLKFAAGSLPVPAAELARLRRLLDGRPLWLAAQTHAGEEAAALQVHAALSTRYPALLSIVVPRHPGRGEEIAALAGAVAVTRRAAGQDPPVTGGAWVVDTMGELGLLYALVGHAFVGKSLVPPGGGQNPLEPARLGCAVAVGPYTANFSDAVAALEQAGGLARVEDASALAAWVARMFDDEPGRRAIGAAGMGAASRSAELPDRVAGLLAGLLVQG